MENRPLLPSTIKSTDILSRFLKAGLAFSTLALLLLFFYVSLSYQPFRYDYQAFEHLLQRRTTAAPRASSASQQPTSISHILFGIGGSVKTWQKRRHYSELWWQPNVTRGFLWLEDKPPDNETLPETSPQYKVSANTSSFKYTWRYGSRSAIRIARIVKESFALGLENVRWFVMGDDDTVFFTDNLVTVLAKYDHSQMYYIGGISESVEQNVKHTYTMAYGGGGFAISYPLAAELANILDGCIDRYAHFYGSDQKIQGCISEIGVPISIELGFHQVDIRGDPYGFLAAHPVAPLVSLHHLEYVEPIFPNMTREDSVKHLVTAYKLDPGRILQHSFCYDLRRNWSVSVAWGYSVELYPSLVTSKELETAIRTFRTWRTRSDKPFTFDTRPLRNNSCEKPLVYFLDRVENVGGGQTRSTYRKFVNVTVKECKRADYLPALAVKFVNVFAPQFVPNLWKKAPRRQCCEIMEGNDGVEGVAHVMIRGCHQHESVTPP